MASLSVCWPALTGHDLRAQHLHAKDVQRLPLAIHRAHIDHAFQPEHRGDRGGGDAVLARARLGDDARLAHAPRQQDLADAVVDLVRAGVEQVFALEINLRPAQLAREPLGKIQRRRAAAKLLQVILELALKFRVALRPEIFGLQLLQRMHQRLRHIPAAVGAEMAARIRHVALAIELMPCTIAAAPAAVEGALSVSDGRNVKGGRAPVALPRCDPPGSRQSGLIWMLRNATGSLCPASQNSPSCGPCRDAGDWP